MRNYHAEAMAAVAEHDLAAPYVTAGTPDYSTDEIQQPPSQDDTAKKIAEILVAGGTVYVIAQAIFALLHPLGITIPAITAALNLSAGGRDPHRVKPKYVAEGLDRFNIDGKVMRVAANEELYYRAAYILNASYRIQKSYMNGTSLKASMEKEAANWNKHKDAREGRMKAARSVAQAFSLYGPVLGWYLNPLLNNEAACIAASGNNFRADTMPLIGFPGLVHINCGCKAGPPIEGAGWVDDAVKGKFKRVRKAKLLRLKTPDRERKAS